MGMRFFHKRFNKTATGALAILFLAAAPALWGQTAQPTPPSAPGAEPSFSVLDVTTGSGSKSQDDKPALQIEMLDLTPPNPAAAAEAAREAALADPNLTPAQRESKAREAALMAALDQWHSQTLGQYNYDIATLQDPFMPIREVRGKPANAGGEAEADDFAALPPVLRLELNQLKLVAITTRSGSGAALASFEDGAGASYILRQGDRIGRRQGRVTGITSNMVVVEEPARAPGERPRVTEIKLSAVSTSGLTRLGGQAETPVEETALGGLPPELSGGAGRP